MDKRYQVFISSTYHDLIEERNEVMQALLELECMPAGMELFPASNDTQWNWIKKIIDESDYYIVIVGGKYGTISNDTGLSYTEMEYRYAIDKNIPVIGFLHDNILKLPLEKNEQELERKEKLEEFRELVTKKLCKFYSNPSDLGAKVSRSLTQLKKQFPAVGWIKANEVADYNYSKEIMQLRNLNEKLKREIEYLSNKPPDEILSFQSGNDMFKVDFIFTRSRLNEKTNRFNKYKQENCCIDISWDDLWKLIAPNILRSIDIYRTYWGGDIFSDLLEIKSQKLLSEKYPDENYSEFYISKTSLNTILMQFRVLKYIELDEHGDWKITPFGDKYYTDQVAQKK